MSYMFYPYFWADKNDWKELFQLQDAADPLFQSFLQSGMARVVLPVREGFEETVLYYFQTGELWSGQGLVFDSDNELYLSIAEELQEPEGEIEETWETRVPTTLTIVQQNSAPLNENGLPCYCENEDDPMATGNSMLVGENGEAVSNDVAIISTQQPIYTAVYDEEDSVDDGIDEYRFKVYDKSGVTILSGNKKYDSREEAIKALNYTIFTILDDPGSITHTPGSDGKWHYKVTDFNDVYLARRIDKFNTEAESVAQADAMIDFLREITMQ